MKSFVVLSLLFFCAVVTARSQAPVPSQFAIIERLIGKTWRGVFEGKPSDRPMVDIARWELALGGKAVRIRHVINDGLYGGETFIMWDDVKQSLVYFYFTTAGFYTSGSMREEDGVLVAREAVTGQPEKR